MSYIYETLSEIEIANRLYQERDKNGFDFPQCGALAQYLCELSEDSGEPVEFDQVAIRCEWTAYDSWEEIRDSYSDFEEMVLAELETMAEPEESEMLLLAEQFLSENTLYLRVNETFLVYHF